MKKTLLALVVLVGLYSSCTNDEITVSRAITFKVNPATVVDNLYERSAGDLTSLSSGSKLIVSLFIYDEKGALVSKEENEYSAYTHMMNADIYLPAGKYTAVATTHVTSSVEFWTFSGLDQLSTFKITDNGYIGGKSKILGLTIKSFTVGDNSETYTINVENAGAVALVWFYQWNKYTGVKSYSLMGKQSCDYVSFDNSGMMDYSIRSESSYIFYKAKFDYDSKYTGATAYFFTFPIKNASFRFYAETTDGEYIAMSQEFVDDVVQGESYVFLYEFKSGEGEYDEAYWYTMTPSATRSTSDRINLDKYKLSENDRILYDYEGQSISIR